MQQYNTRISLKSDTEARWRLVHDTFVPLAGEMIIYSQDNTHSYCRVKIGDGSSTLSNLEFIDSGTINGKEVEIVKISDFEHRPLIGSPDKLYIDISTNIIYHYDPYNGYAQLSNFSLQVDRTVASKITNWSSGVLPEMSVNNNVLILKNGYSPSLSYYDAEVVSNVQKG